MNQQAEQREKRPPAPKVRCAEAKAQAEALEASAGALRTAGLPERAEELEREATELRKKNVELPAGRRLDLARTYLGRCEARGRRADEAVEAARAKLLEAEVLKASADKETADAQAQLEKLRGDLTGAGGDDAMAAPEDELGGDAEKRLAARVQAQQRELEQLRRDLGLAQEAMMATQPAATVPLDTFGDEKGLEELETELRRAQEAYTKAVREGGTEAQDPAQARQLAELSEQVAAKRRRV